MVEWITRLEVIRTTADGCGGWCGIVTGMDATPELALAELRREGEELARRLVEEESEAFEAAEAAKAAEAVRRLAEARDAYEARRMKVLEEERRRLVPWEVVLEEEKRKVWLGLEPRDDRPRLCRFEVVDVRLTPALEEGGPGGWLAYGTLAWVGESRSHREDRRQGE
jgi:hypothetical protein